MFTMENTYAEILHAEMEQEMKMILGNMLFSEECITSLLPPKAYHKTLKEIRNTLKTPWGNPFPADEILLAANLAEEIFVEKKWEIRPLWDITQEVTFDNASSSVCLFTPVLSDTEKRPALLLVPGGGYGTLAMTGEGFDLAKIALEHGFRPYILRYRRLPAQFPTQQIDLSLAIHQIHAWAEQDHTLGNDLTIAGFSAGGHLCASTVTHWEEMKDQMLCELKDSKRAESFQKLSAFPEKMILGYAVTSLEKEFCEGLPGVCPEEERSYYSPLRHVSGRMPKTFLFACEDDTLVNCRHSICMDQVMRDAGAQSLCRIYPTGGHGISAGRGTSAENWFEEMLVFME